MADEVFFGGELELIFGGWFSGGSLEGDGVWVQRLPCLWSLNDGFGC